MMTQRQKQEQAKRRRAAASAANIGIHYTQTVINSKAAGDQLRKLSGELQALRTSRINCTPESTGGYAAELHHKRTFLADAARKGRRDLDVRVGPRGGHGSEGTPDLTVLKNGKTVSEAGLKYRGTAKQSAYDQSNVFDRGRQKIVPKDQLPRVKELSGTRAKVGAIKSPDYADTHRNASDRLRYKNVESQPLGKQQSMEIVKDPSRYARQAFRNDMQTYAKSGAATGAAIGAAASLASNAVDVFKGRRSAGEAVVRVAKDAAFGSAKGAALGATTAVVKQGMLMAGAKQLARGSAPAAIASAAFEAGVDIAEDVKKWSRGEITSGTFARQAVGHTASAAAKGGGAYAGAQLGVTIGLIGGPIGAAAGGLVGGTIGYFASSGIVSTVRRWFS